VSESGFGGSFSASGGSVNCFTVGMISATLVGLSPPLIQFTPCSATVTVSDGVGHSATAYVQVL
jgi:hypothetical protein